MDAPHEDEIAACLASAFIAAPGTSLRREDRQKVRELAGFLKEVHAATRSGARAGGGKGGGGKREGAGPDPGGAPGKDLGGRSSEPFVLVDAAAGKCALGLLAAKLLFVPASRPVRVFIVERDADRLAAAREAAGRLALPDFVEIVYVPEDLTCSPSFPAAPGLVVALHACGGASDAVIARSIEAQARRLLLAPCCMGESVPFFAPASRLHAAWQLPRQAPVRQRFVRAMVEAERTLVLEAAGYETEVVPFVAPTVTPENLVWRARRVGEPRRKEEAQQRLAHLYQAAREAPGGC